MTSRRTRSPPASACRRCRSRGSSASRWRVCAWTSSARSAARTPRSGSRLLRMGELLAVYGTLMSGQSYAGRPDVETLMRPVGPCRLRGRLYSEGDYPWLVAGDEGEVAGELYEVLEPATFELLDAY